MLELVHAFHLYGSRALAIGGIGLCIMSLYLMVRRADVTPPLRWGAYGLAVLAGIQFLIGLALYWQGRRALEPDIHLVYGVGTVLVLPFFIYIEQTARKRPATSTYLVAGFILIGLTVRSILTGG